MRVWLRPARVEPGIPTLGVTRFDNKQTRIRCLWLSASLKQNGSQIHPWWIYHHYISATMSVVVLTWGDTYVPFGRLESLLVFLRWCQLFLHSATVSSG